MRRPLVIVVEDEPMNRLIAVDMLDEAGFDVVDFGRADEAVEHAQSHDGQISALFTDINVPGDRDGIELARLVARRWPDIFILVTSGRFGDMRPPELPPSVHYTSKPWRAKTVVDILRSGIGSKASQSVSRQQPSI